MKKLTTQSMAVALLIYGSNVHAVLSQAPLEISTSITPNVMMLLDDSGSMNHIIRADEFENVDPASYAGWNFSGGHIQVRNMNQGNCPSGFIEGQNPGLGITKCLKLPDPVGGGNTRYLDDYLGYLFTTYSDGQDLTINNTIPTDYRLGVLKTVGTDLVNQIQDVSFCLADFGTTADRGPHGGYISAACGASTTTLESAINGLTANSWTPLAETYYEITRYFRGMEPYFRPSQFPNNNGNPATFVSPVEYRCQKNFVIAITDGYPTRDFDQVSANSNRYGSANNPSETRASHNLTNPLDAGGTPVPGALELPDWDGLSPVSTQQDFLDQTLQPFSDGFGGSSFNTEGATLYLDDLALFGHEIDLLKSGNDLSGKPFGDALPSPMAQADNTDFKHQNIRTYTVGFSIDNQMLSDAADYGGGSYYTANNSDQLTGVLSSALLDIKATSGSSSSTTATTAFLSGGEFVYQAKYDSGDWSGSLLAFKIRTNQANFGELREDPKWNAANNMPAPDNRKLLTAKKRIVATIDQNEFEPVLFQWANLSTYQQGELNNDPLVLNYVRGDQTNEVEEGGTFRNRLFVLPDFVHAAPLYLGGIPSGNYPDADYQVFIDGFDPDQGGVERKEVIYAGANGGIFHAFKARGTATTGGKELLGYVPFSVYPNLAELSDPAYAHRYYADGAPSIVDAKIDTGGVNPEWQSVLAAPLGAGGKAIFALNVTDPNDYSLNTASKRERVFMWEINDEYPLNSAGTVAEFEDLGYILTRISIIRVPDSSGGQRWFVVTGNGVLSDDGKAVLYVINLSDGTLHQKLVVDAPAAMDNGLSSLTAVDFDDDEFMDRLYGGDLKGNVWRFDWDSAADQFYSYYQDASNNPEPLFHAESDDPNSAGMYDQAITTDFEIGIVPGKTTSDGVMVFFGTGRYFELADNPDPADTDPLPKEAFHGVWDSGVDSNLDSTDLVEQTFTSATIGTQNIRTSTDNPVDYNVKHGWFIELPTKGERIVYDSFLIRGRILFVSLIPNANDNSDRCISPVSGWLMELEAFTGARPTTVVFDANNDGSYTSADTSGGQTVSGLQPLSGAPLPPSVVRQANPNDVNGDGVPDDEFAKFSSTTAGDVIRVTNPASIARTSWRRTN